MQGDVVKTARPAMPLPTKPLVQLDKEQPYRETETKALWTEIVSHPVVLLYPSSSLS